MSSENRFGYEWNKYDFISPEYEEQFLYWVEPYGKDRFKDKSVLDAGCGMGRNSFFALKYGAKQVVAFDYGAKSVQAAKKNLSSFKNAQVKHQSIYDISYDQEFDIAFSIGVIHHLKDPKLAVKKLWQSVKPGGYMLIWVYGYKGNEKIVKYINPIRKNITSRLPAGLVHIISYLFSIPLWLVVKINKNRSDYFKRLNRFSFWHTHSIVFDQLIPEIANYWTKEQAMSLFDGLPGVEKIKGSPINNMSWTIIAKKKMA